ncbi:ABC transporter permease [Herbiconiux sp. P15]|uniref:ABC transporter permease n=1 Tax=Herbiconiux liukaitaii TaxID=3342799 RepID=UPI0035B9B321
MSAAVDSPRTDRPRPGTSHLRRWIGIVPFAVLVLVAVVGPMLVPFDPTKVVGPSSTPPGGAHLFGTDSAGMDVFSRTVAATRINLIIALGTTVIATAIGVILGLAIGMNESRSGAASTLARGTARVVDLIEAVPAVLTGLVIVSFYGSSVLTLTVAMAIILSPIQIRLVRTEVLRVRRESYLDAARMAGDSEWRLTLRTVLPNSSWAALENTSVVFAISIILTASLGFIGVGLPVPAAEWGSMLSRGATDALVSRWWPAAFPTLALAFAVVAASLAAHTVFGRSARSAAGR